MDLPAPAAGSRRNEDIALDLMKFIAMTTGYGKTASTAGGVGFEKSSGGAASPRNTAHLLTLYSQMPEAVGIRQRIGTSDGQVLCPTCKRGPWPPSLQACYLSQTANRRHRNAEVRQPGAPPSLAPSSQDPRSARVGGVFDPSMMVSRFDHSL
jgi:hypothetical protein